MKNKIYKAKKKKKYPERPCKICIVQASCILEEQMFKCQTLMDYCNAKYYKDPSHVCTFNINGNGVWQVFVTGRTDTCTIEDIVELSEGKSMNGGPIFDYKKHLEYTKHLEACTSLQIPK